MFLASFQGVDINSAHLTWLTEALNAKTGHFISIDYTEDGISEGGMRKGRMMYVISFK